MKRTKKMTQQRNEDMMFIGIDGFHEIESLFPEESYAHARTEWKKPEKRVRMKTAKAIFAARKKSAQPRRKKRALAAAAFVAAVMLSLTSVAAAAQEQTALTEVAKVSVADAPLCGGYQVVSPSERKDYVEPIAEPEPEPEYVEEVEEVYDYTQTYDSTYTYEDTIEYYDAPYYALYIDGVLIAYVEDGAGLQAALDQILANEVALYDDVTTTACFENSVEVVPYYDYDVDYTEDVDDLIAAIDGLYAIRLETNWVDVIEVPYESEVTYDDTLPEDYEETTQEGQTGVQYIVTRLTFINRELVGKTVTYEQYTEEIINEKKLVGSSYYNSVDLDDLSTEIEPEVTETETATPETVETETTETETPAPETTETETVEQETEPETEPETVVEETPATASSSTADGSSTGSFIWPLPHTHNLTSLMEERWGRMHNGIDIAGGDDYGQPIIAADGGTVIWSGNDGGGYGNYVMIDHGNGYVTVYGHASSLACSTGDYVNQGDVIAYVGSTGNSTGPHLHFEIRLNGEYQNPLNYVS